MKVTDLLLETEATEELHALVYHDELFRGSYPFNTDKTITFELEGKKEELIRIVVAKKSDKNNATIHSISFTAKKLLQSRIVLNTFHQQKFTLFDDTIDDEFDGMFGQPDTEMPMINVHFKVQEAGVSKQNYI